MADLTPAQEEFNDLVAKNARETSRVHPEDRDDTNTRDSHELDEEDSYRASQIDAAMRIQPADRDLKLPPASFDAGRTTGVKGVIADARNYEEARKTSFITRAKSTVRRSIFGLDSLQSAPTPKQQQQDSEDESHASDSPDEAAFLQQWRESRRRELESDASKSVRNRRTSPSVRIYGRLDEVDALGYLDAIEKVGRDTTVVVFVYDHESDVSETIESALRPLVRQHTAIHFVKVHYLDIEFDNAAVPSILAYRNQGDMFANLTGIIEMIPDDEPFGRDTLRRLFEKHDIL
ncbi:Phosducin-like protein like [Verticillium longisporum]|uniref:Phosducin-like protein like n=1 Tax=Verticillium longisporum TaxID=100787 RepID=A0A8I3ATT1_VERLO|nr:Phosducin-like protein like [Verticillium longisporum]KAG7137603.1 Phosducin-like protein like [Verticillium longisporum]